MESQADKGKARAESLPPSPPASVRSTATEKSQQALPSRYPPGVRDIIDRKPQNNDDDFDCDPHGIFGRRAQKWNWKSATKQCVAGPSNSRPQTAPVSSGNAGTTTLTNQLSPRAPLSAKQAVIASFSELTACDEAIRWVQITSQGLVQIRDGMWTTLCQYFNRAMIHIFEVPAYRQLRKVINRLVVRLALVEHKLVDASYLKEDSAEFKMMQEIEGGLRFVVDEGLEILRFWNHREDSQKLGSPFSKKDRRMRGIAIHDMNGRVENLRRRAEAVEDTILGQDLLQDVLQKRNWVMFVRLRMRSNSI